MSIKFMGGEMASFTPSGGTAIEQTAGGSYFDPLFARCYVEAQGSDYFTTPVLPSMTVCWSHFQIWYTSSFSVDMTVRPVRFLDSSGQEVVRLVHHSYGVAGAGTGINTLDFEYTNDGGTTWIATGLPATVNPDVSPASATIDVRIICNSTSGLLELYSSGTRILTKNVDLHGVTNIAQLKFIGDQFGGFAETVRISECIVADAPTVGYRLLTRYPTGNSATNTAWTGDFTAVDEIQYSDADAISSSTVNQVETYTNSGPTMPGTYFIKAIGVYARAKNDGTGPANLQMAIRASGANYFSATQTLGLGYGGTGAIFETDPSTGQPFVNAQIDAIETGVKSIT